MKRPYFLLLVPLAAAAASGPYDQPYSIIEKDPIRSADPNVIPLVINRVDDRNALNLARAVVPPGRHQVTVDVPARKGFPASQHTFELTTEPCTRYYIAAKLDNPVGQRWEPIVRSHERIGECEKKFALAR
ncbi:MAG TPA: hypothetical protein VEG27_04305 [Usitatibacter sp.]|nr:hypothetical protein [Usitatibacter sp.]